MYVCLFSICQSVSVPNLLVCLSYTYIHCESKKLGHYSRNTELLEDKELATDFMHDMQ